MERARRRGRASGERKRGAQTGSGWERTAWDCETARPTKAPVPVRLIVREGARVREGRGRLVHLRVRYDGEGVQPLALQTLPSRHIKALILKSKRLRRAVKQMSQGKIVKASDLHHRQWRSLEDGQGTAPANARGFQTGRCALSTGVFQKVHKIEHSTRLGGGPSIRMTRF